MLSIAVSLGCRHEVAMHCLGQVLGNPEMEKRANQHEDYLARYVEMDGRGIEMSTAFPSFAKDGFVAVQCKDIEVTNMDYRNVGVYATCDSWFCLGMDEFQNTTGACSRGCGSGGTASWAVRFSAVLRDSEGDKIEALFEGHYCTEVLFENKRKEGWHINAPGVPCEDDVFNRGKEILQGARIWLLGWARPKDGDATEAWIHVVRFGIHGPAAPAPPAPIAPVAPVAPAP